MKAADAALATLIFVHMLLLPFGVERPLPPRFCGEEGRGLRQRKRHERIA